MARVVVTGALAEEGGHFQRTTRGKIRGPANLAGAWSAQPVPASPRPPRAAHRPAAARAPRTTPGCTCGHGSAPPTAPRPRASARFSADTFSTVAVRAAATSVRSDEGQPTLTCICTPQRGRLTPRSDPMIFARAVEECTLGKTAASAGMPPPTSTMRSDPATLPASLGGQWSSAPPT